MYSASDVKDLRERTGAGMMDCKKALDASNGDMEKAIDWLRENGMAKAENIEKGIQGADHDEEKQDAHNSIGHHIPTGADMILFHSHFCFHRRHLTKDLCRSPCGRSR